MPGKNSDIRLPVSALIAPNATLPKLCEAAARCKGRDLWKKATHTVFGEGSGNAKVVLLGEQPGDREDIEGRPFVGPAGRILDDALREVRIDVYVTNVVKHFRWDAAARGKRRIHKKPHASEIHARRPWLEAELAVVRPQVLVCLGATAAPGALRKTLQSESGAWKISPKFPCTARHGHRAPVLRPSLARFGNSPCREMERFVQDLRQIADLLQRERPAA